MQLHRFDLNLLKALDALLTEKNVTHAAERVFLSQPAMSGALKRLRDELNDQLLVRVGRDLELTPLGRSLAASIPRLLRSIQDTLDSRPSFDPSSTRRSFNFAMTDYASFVILPHVLERLRKEAPYMTCHIQTVDETTYSGLVGGDVDLFVGIKLWADLNEARSNGNLECAPLFSDDFVCMVSSDHPEIGDAITINQYCELPHAVVRFRRQADSLIESCWQQMGLDIQVALTAPNFAALLLTLPQTRLIATVPRRLAETLSTSLALKLVECPIAIPSLDEMAVWHSRASLDPAHDYIRSTFLESAKMLKRNAAISH